MSIAWMRAATSYLTKPIDKAALLRTIARAAQQAALGLRPDSPEGPRKCGHFRPVEAPLKARHTPDPVSWRGSSDGRAPD